MKAVLLVMLAGSALVVVPRVTPTPDLPRVVANDNRVPSGRLVQDTLHLDLVLQRADWYPEAETGPSMTVEAFGEAGQLPSIPAPLIRVREGTVIRATVRNALADSTAQLIGFGVHPITTADTIPVPPGATAVVTFLAGAPGTYLYRAVIGHDPDDRGEEHETTGGAFVVDPAGGSRPDRIFVMNIAFREQDSAHVEEVLAINGRSWPHTERLQMTQGDSVRWRVLNATVRNHPMHLHGFYFRTTAIGDGLTSRAIPTEAQALEVTEGYLAWNTRELVWSPDRPGNWLYHCHLTFHVVPKVRLGSNAGSAHETHSTDPAVHMAGLVLGLTVHPTTPKRPAAPATRSIHLWVNQGGPRARMGSTFSYIVQQGNRVPRPDSVQLVGTPLMLTRGTAVDVTVHNRGTQASGIHWHGIELESWSDGVVGWSGDASAMAPPILPGGTFTARLLLPRAGTFMYHTHMNDIEQVTAGAVGAIVVLEPGERFDPTRDHIFLAHWNGQALDSVGLPSLLINGDSVASRQKTLAIGVTHRIRLINIGPAGVVRFAIRQDRALASWQPIAKDGADLPPPRRLAKPAEVFLNVGEIYDFAFTPPAPGRYEISAAFGRTPTVWRQTMIVH